MQTETRRERGTGRGSCQWKCHVMDDSHLPELPKGSIAGTLRSRSLRVQSLARYPTGEWQWYMTRLCVSMAVPRSMAVKQPTQQQLQCILHVLPLFRNPVITQDFFNTQYLLPEHLSSHASLSCSFGRSVVRKSSTRRPWNFPGAVSCRSCHQEQVRKATRTGNYDILRLRSVVPICRVSRTENFPSHQKHHHTHFPSPPLKRAVSTFRGSYPVFLGFASSLFYQSPPVSLGTSSPRSQRTSFIAQPGEYPLVCDLMHS
jgi:hypothetical protein